MTRLRLSRKQAQALGFEPKEPKGSGNPRYQLTDQQVKALRSLNKCTSTDSKVQLPTETNKSSEQAYSVFNSKGEIMSFEEYCRVNKIDFQSVRSWKLLTYKNPPRYNIEFKALDQTSTLDDFKADLLEMIQKNSPTYPTLKRVPQTDPHLLVINPADIHIGKLAEAIETQDEYNIQIAVQRVLDGVQGIVNKAQGFNINKIIFVGGNDILHTDNPRRTTTSGTPQDCQGMWHSNYLRAFQLYVDVLESLISIADVHFVYCPSNHDYTQGFFLCNMVEQYFRLNPQITFDCSIAHRKYFRYESNLLGFTHGDGGKVQDLPLTMAHEARQDWGVTDHKYIFTHHVHHKNAKDYQGVAVESMRSPSGADSWHKTNQYANNIKAVEGFIIHPQEGQVARLNHIFRN